MNTISRIILCSIVILSAISLKPAISEAAWWKPATWFNNWSFDLPTDQPIDIGNTPNPTQTSVQTTLVAPAPKPSTKIIPPPTNPAPPKNSLNQLRTAVNSPSTNKPLIVSVSPRTATSTTPIAIYGSDFSVLGQNYVVLTDRKYDNLTPGTTMPEIEIIAQTTLGGSKITFSMDDVRTISAGTYDLFVRNSSGIRSNIVKFIVTETKVVCPTGYTCVPGTSEESQIEQCPAGYVCTLVPEIVIPESDSGEGIPEVSQ